MLLKNIVESANTGLDAIQRAPIVLEETGLKCLRIQDISQSKDFDRWGNTIVSEENRKAFSLKKNDIIIARTGSTIGVNFFVSKNLKSVYNNGLIRLRVDTSKALPYFVYCYLQTKQYSDFIESISGSSATQPNMRINDLLELKIPDKTLSEQQHIVDTIGTVDNLIEKYQETDTKIMSLLSMKFEAIKVKNNSIKLEDFAFYQEGPGIRNWQYVDSDGVKFINIRCINDNDMQLDDANMISKEEAYGIYKHFMVQEDDILVSTSGTLGRLAIARKEHLPLCMNTSVIRFRPLVKENYPYLFCFLMSDEFKNLIISMANGSAQLNFGPTHIKKINLLLPEENELKSFNAFAQPLINKRKDLLSKIDKLKSAKSLLLNKYFS